MSDNTLSNEHTARQQEIDTPDGVIEMLAGIADHQTPISLFFEGQPLPYPVKLKHLLFESGQCILDAAAIEDLKSLLKKHDFFYMEISEPSMLLTSAPMQVLETRARGGRLELCALLPASFSLKRQRNFFRASVDRGLRVNALIQSRADLKSIEGRLVDLSIGGCQVAIDLQAAAALQVGTHLEHLRLRFPNGEVFNAAGTVRHIRCDDEGSEVLLGVAFTGGADFERKVWFYVREIEREAARLDPRASHYTAPSRLFEVKVKRPPAAVIKSADDHEPSTLPMYEPALAVSRALSVQLINLQAGAALQPEVLLEQSRALLALLEEDRQALLYALACIEKASPPLVAHGLAVAVRLADLELEHRPRAQLEQITACALVHDFGKVLLPEALRLFEGSMSAEQLSGVRAHVELLRFRLDRSAFEASLQRDILLAINERLDGSGYPRGLDSSVLTPLARLAAVVDVIDAMSRPRSDRPAWMALDIYRFVFNAGDRFDTGCVNRYVRRYGFNPIGSLVAYSGGFHAFVMRLDGRGAPWQVRVVREPGRDRPMDIVLRGEAIAQLGDLEGGVAPQESALMPW